MSVGWYFKLGTKTKGKPRRASGVRLSALPRASSGDAQQRPLRFEAKQIEWTSKNHSEGQ